MSGNLQSVMLSSFNILRLGLVITLIVGSSNQTFAWGKKSIVIKKVSSIQAKQSKDLAVSPRTKDAQASMLTIEPFSFNNAILLPILQSLNQSDLAANLTDGTLSYTDCLAVLQIRLPNANLFSYSTDWFSINIPNWNKILTDNGFFSQNKVVKALEIGSWQGRSSCWIIQNLLLNSASEVHCIDTFGGSMENTNSDENALLFNCFSHNIYIANGQNKCVPYKGISHEVLKKMASEYANYFDFMYIDGSHKADDVFNDAVLAFQLLKKGGLMFFDDYEWEMYADPSLCPKQGIDKFMALYKDQLKVIKIAYQAYFQKI